VTRAAIHPAWGLVEVAALAGLFVFILWGVGPHVATSGWALGVYWAAVASWTAIIAWLSPIVLHRDPPGLRGWGPGRTVGDPGSAANAWPSYLGLTALAAAGLLVWAAVRDPAFVAHVRWGSAGHKLLIYLVWGLVQAMVFFGYVQTRIRTALEAVAQDGRSVRPLVALGVAGLFAAAHAPNWPLAGLVFVMGLGWSWLYWARPNVVLVGASHAVLGTIVYSVLHLFTRIGPFYGHPEGHIVRNAVPGLKALVGDLF
jgi:membrane protease YdiL (CAAX protease family)